MATWTRASSEPITTEREVRVINTETGAEGYVGVYRPDGFGIGGPAKGLYGPVCRVDRVYDEYGAEVEEPKRTVIDPNPTFA